MSGRQHTSAEWQRSHSAGQQRIIRYCSCGRRIVGNAAWWSHSNANPDHRYAGASAPTAQRDGGA